MKTTDLESDRIQVSGYPFTPVLVDEKKKKTITTTTKETEKGGTNIFSKPMLKKLIIIIDKHNLVRFFGLLYQSPKKEPNK